MNRTPEQSARYWKAQIERKGVEWNRERQRKFHKKRALFIAILKSRPCADCKIQYHYSQMEFDHRPGTVKLMQLGVHKKDFSLKEIIQESRKCDVVCANCHALRTWKRLTVNQAAGRQWWEHA